MTETNINALCSVEAVFDGVDIEVTVEFSAGGGTFKHDELTAESREKADQHPIESITGLQSALDGKSNVGHGHDISGISGLTLADSPEFADTQITPLSVEATYTPTVWGYLVSLFTTVPKSVKEHLVKIWTIIENLKSRIGILEDSYLLKYVVPVDTTVISLTTDRYGNAFNMEEGTTYQICLRVNAFVGGQPNNINIRFNNNSNAIYAWATIITTSFQLMGSNYNGGSCLFTFTFINGEIDAIWGSNIKNSKTYFNGQQIYKGCTTALNADILTEIKLSVENANYPIPAGTVIIIKKL